jgi:hemolysin activation/secretion protein
MKRFTFSCSLLAGVLSAAVPCVVYAEQDNSVVQPQDETFNIDHFEVDGNTLLPAAEVEKLVAPMAGPHRVYGDIQKALEAVEGAYRKAGFSTVNVYVPEQELTSGVVHITVVENVLGHIEITGNKYFNDANVLNGLQPLRIGEPPNLRDVSAAVQLGNENAAKQVAVSLAASEIPGQIDAKVAVTDSKPRRIFATVDNTGTDATGRWRTGIAWQENNLFNRDQSATLAYTTSPDSPSGVAVHLYSLGYRVPFYTYGDSLEFIYGKSSVNTPNSLPGSGSALGVIGKGDVAGLRWNHYLAREGEHTGKIVFGLDYKHIDSSCTLDGVDLNAAGPVGACTPYTTRPISVTYVGQQVSTGQQVDYNIGVVRNWAMGGRHQNSDTLTGAPTEDDRYSFVTPGNRTSQDDFMILRGGASIFKGWANDWQMRLAATMQYSPYAIVSSEQIGLVGSTAVRGFDERAISSDSGVVANAELYTPELAAKIHIPGTLRLLTFYDFGAGYNSHIGGGTTPGTVDVASLGIGARYSSSKDFNLRADLARVMIAGRTSTAPTDTFSVRRGDWQASISAVLGF